VRKPYGWVFSLDQHISLRDYHELLSFIGSLVPVSSLSLGCRPGTS
jgi:hypothetical protein